MNPTSGPWEAALHTPEGPTKALWCVVGPDRRVIARVDGSSAIALADARLMAASPDLLNAMPTLPHSGGRLIKVVAHYEDGSTQAIDGEVVAAAIEKATTWE